MLACSNQYKLSSCGIIQLKGAALFRKVLFNKFYSIVVNCSPGVKQINCIENLKAVNYLLTDAPLKLGDFSKNRRVIIKNSLAP